MCIRTSTLTALVAALILLGPLSHRSYALDSGGGTSGGGDPCKNEIDKHRREILGWIERDEAKDLDFSKLQVPGWTYDDPRSEKRYKPSMLEVLQQGKVAVTCYLD